MHEITGKEFNISKTQVEKSHYLAGVGKKFYPRVSGDTKDSHTFTTSGEIFSPHFSKIE